MGFYSAAAFAKQTTPSEISFGLQDHDRYGLYHVFVIIIHDEKTLFESISRDLSKSREYRDRIFHFDVW